MLQPYAASAYPSQTVLSVLSDTDNMISLVMELLSGMSAAGCGICGVL